MTVNRETWIVARRWTGIAGYVLAMVALFHNNLTVPETRGIAVLGLATALSVAVGYELSVRGWYREWGLAIVLGIPLMVGGAYAFLKFLLTPVPPTGPLQAANEPTPPSVCQEKAQGDDLLIVLGTSRVIASGPGPFTPLKAMECPTVRLIRQGAGLVVEGAGYDTSNSLAYLVRDNRLDMAWVTGLRARRPDRSTFELVDRFNQEVIYVRYLNPGAVRIRGRFLCGTDPQVVVRDEGTLVGGLRIGGVMFGQRFTRGHVCARTGPGMPYGIHVQKG